MPPENRFYLSGGIHSANQKEWKVSTQLKTVLSMVLQCSVNDRLQLGAFGSFLTFRILFVRLIHLFSEDVVLH